MSIDMNYSINQSATNRRLVQGQFVHSALLQYIPATPCDHAKNEQR